MKTNAAAADDNALACLEGAGLDVPVGGLNRDCETCVGIGGHGEVESRGLRPEVQDQNRGAFINKISSPGDLSLLSAENFTPNSGKGRKTMLFRRILRFLPTIGEL